MSQEENGTFYITQAALDEKYSRDALTKHCRQLARSIFAGNVPLEDLRKLYGLTTEEFGRIRELPPFKDEMKILRAARQAAKQQGNATSGGGQ